jgi:hypothetical protein
VKALYKNTIVIWTTDDPTELELTELAHQAENGYASCSSIKGARVADPEKDPDFDGTEFFRWGTRGRRRRSVCGSLLSVAKMRNPRVSPLFRQSTYCGSLA